MTLVVGVFVLVVAVATSVELVIRYRVNALALIPRTFISLLRIAWCAAFCWLMLRVQQHIR